jgi:outer membrane protein OmpA-like peptidoglycan-associated protein
LGIIRRIFKPAALLLAFHMLMVSGPYQSVWAAMVGTEAIIKIDRGQKAQERLNSYLQREDIIALLESRGIDPQEVKARVDGLTDAELDRIADMIDQLPAGRGFFETLIIVLFLVFLILLITDISGYTNVFPFVKKQAAGKKARDPAVVESGAQQQTRPTRTVAGINPDEPLIVYFNRNSNNLTANAYERLDRVALFMAKNPKTEITIKGFSDSTGTASYDQMVSEIRANTVKNYLIAKGVAPKKISTTAGGSQGTSDSNTSGEKGLTDSRAIIEFK